MKLSYNQIESFARNINAAQRGILIYGPDHGLIQERAAEVMKRILPNPDDPFALTDLSGDQIKEDPAILADEVAAMNFFGGRKVIRIRDAAEKAAEALKAVFENPPAGRPEEMGFVLVLAEELQPKSPLRALFESGSDIAALPCYHDEGAGLATIIRSELQQRGFNASPDIPAYLTSVLKGDRMLVRQEMEKLDLYAGAVRNLSLEMVRASVGDLAESTLDDVVDHAALGNLEETDKQLRKALGQGVMPIVLLRTLSRHFQRMAQVSSQLEKGVNLEQAMQQLRPQIFFKQQPIFKRQMSLWSRSAKIRRALQLLYQAELRIKTSGLDPELMTERAISMICRQASAR